jgi:hypothetical protein
MGHRTVHSILNLPQASQLLPRRAGAGGMTILLQLTTGFADLQGHQTGLVAGQAGTAGLSTPLRFGRDDNSVGELALRANRLFLVRKPHEAHQGHQTSREIRGYGGTL